MESAGDPDVEENPEWVWVLFRHYDKLYFRGALVIAAFSLEWTYPRTKTISAFGSCSFGKMSKTITLYRTNRSSADLKNALLHLMIHAIIFVKHGMTCLSSHGPVFRDWMHAINACSIEDYLLVNKRTERRKRERERAVQITYSRSRKRSASEISSMKAQPAEEVSSQQTKPPSIIFIGAAGEAVTQDPRDHQQPAPRMDIVGVPPANQVKTPTPRGQIQPPAQCLDTAAVPPTDQVMTQALVLQSQPPAPCSIATDKVVPPHSADPPSLLPSNPSSSPDVIDISDDD